MNPLSRYNLVHKFIPMPQAMKNTRYKGSSGKKWATLEKIPAWILTKVKERVAAKSNPTTMNQTSTVSTSSSSVNHPITSKSLGILKASTGKPDARARRNSKPDAASSSQRESTIYQESTPKVCERVIPSDCEVDQGSERNNRSDHNRLQAAYVEIDDSSM